MILTGIHLLSLPVVSAQSITSSTTRTPTSTLQKIGDYSVQSGKIYTVYFDKSKSTYRFQPSGGSISTKTFSTKKSLADYIISNNSPTIKTPSTAVVRKIAPSPIAVRNTKVNQPTIKAVQSTVTTPVTVQKPVIQKPVQSATLPKVSPYTPPVVLKQPTPVIPTTPKTVNTTTKAS